MKKTTTLLVAIALLGFSGLTPAIGAELSVQESESMLAPLPPDDPRAQVDPSLKNVPEASAPAMQTDVKLSRRKARQAVSHDLASGETTPERTRIRTPRGKSSPEAVGAAAQDDAVPGERLPDIGIDGKVIWGADDRVRITPTTSYPWRAQTKLFSRFPNGLTYGCSGTLINPKYVLTAGHCVFDSTKGGWANRIEVVPGYDNGYRPYGSAYATWLRSVTAWTSSADPSYDYALITLDRAIGNTVGWFGYGSFSDSTIYSGAANVSGYPGDKCGAACQYYDSDPFSSLTSNTVHYLTDTYAGQSGSGVYIFYNSGRYVVAAHRGTCSASSNCGVRINSSRYSQIQGWIATGY